MGNCLSVMRVRESGGAGGACIRGIWLELGGLVVDHVEEQIKLTKNTHLS